MNMMTKNTIFDRYLSEYLKVDKGRKSEILDHVCDVTLMHRKAVIRRFHVLQMKNSGSIDRRGRPVFYTPDVKAALWDVWDAANRPCGELLFPLIDEYIDAFVETGEWNHSDEATNKLRAMKEHTVRRHASTFRKKYDVFKGRSSTKPSHLKSIIPIFKGPWNDLPPGHGQLDTVAHCGDSLLGDFVYTVNYTDTATYWVIPRAQWNKGQRVTLESLKTVQKKLPIPWLGGHPDTGSEFINWIAKEWFDEQKIKFTRSEPGKKNDNMYVEERNGHVVRKYLGYTRFDCSKIVPLINELYDVLASYLNHFQAVRRTVEKKRVGAKYKRIYEKKPKTPYHRMLEHPGVSRQVKDKLTQVHKSLNPLLLKRQIDILTTRLIKKQTDYRNRNITS